MRAHRGVASAPKLDAVGNVKFWECPSKTTKMLVALNTLTLHPGSMLSITFVVRNTGTKPCSYTAPYADIAPGPTTTTLQAGPCGSIRCEIATSHGHELWPGPQLVNCPPWVSPSWPPAPLSRAPARGTRTSPTRTVGSRRASTR